MSSGQKSCYEDEEMASVKSHRERLEMLGVASIATTIEDILSQFHYLESETLSLPRSAWARLDRIKALVSKLS